MSESKHTPGPWACISGGRSGEFTVYLPSDGMVICSRNQYDDKHAEFLANARLIAAAPEMLAALKIAQQFMSIASDWNIDEAEIDGEMRSTYDWLEIVNAALAKATAT